MNAQTPPLAAELDAALQWWRMAGVDCDFADDATDWLGEKAPAENAAASEAPSPSVTSRAQRSPQPKRQVERLDLLGEDPPQTLEAFKQWWLEAPGLDAIGPRGRVAPRGEANADIMVIVIDPEERDRDHLLSGPHGALLGRMLAAMGISEEKTYFASALPRHTPMADTAALAAGGMDKVVAYHIALAAPKRVLAFGANISPLLGHDLTDDIKSLREINHGSRSMPLMVSEGLESMMSMPRLKARFWRRWIEWSAD